MQTMLNVEDSKLQHKAWSRLKQVKIWGVAHARLHDKFLVTPNSSWNFGYCLV